MNEIYAYNETDRALPLEEISRIVNELLMGIGVEGREMAVIFLDDDAIATQNTNDRGVAEPTDVLSYPLSEGSIAMPHVPMLGDVFVSVDTAERQAMERGISLEEELLILVGHGTTHLLGYDHQTVQEWEPFLANQQRALRLGGFDPTSAATYTE